MPRPRRAPKAPTPGRSSLVLALLFLAMGSAFGFLASLMPSLPAGADEEEWFLFGVRALAVVFVVIGGVFGTIGVRRGRAPSR